MTPGGALAAADRQRLHRRPVPRRRGAALLQPRALEVSRAIRISAVRLRRRPPARPEQGRPTWRCCRARCQRSWTHYVKGGAAQPALGGERALTETCPATAPSGGPITHPPGPACIPARSTSARRPPRRCSQAPATRPSRPDDRSDRRPGACATVTATDQGAGVATYRLPAATGSGLHAARLADGDRQPQRHRRVPGDRRAAVGRRPGDEHRDAGGAGVYRVDPPRPTGPRSSSCTPGPGTSPPATSRSSSCSARTPRTCARPTASSRSRSAIFSCASPSTRLRARQVTPPIVAVPLPHPVAAPGCVTSSPTSRIDQGEHAAPIGTRSPSLGTAAEHRCARAPTPARCRRAARPRRK